MKLNSHIEYKSFTIFMISLIWFGYNYSNFFLSSWINILHLFKEVGIFPISIYHKYISNRNRMQTTKRIADKKTHLAKYRSKHLCKSIEMNNYSFLAAMSSSRSGHVRSSDHPSVHPSVRSSHIFFFFSQ